MSRSTGRDEPSNNKGAIMGEIIALIIFFAGGTDGGRAVNTDLRFTNMPTCERAAEKVKAGVRRGSNLAGADAVCVSLR